MVSPTYAKSLWSYNPIPRGCVLFLPLWSPGLRGTRFKSIDFYRHECTVTGAIQVADGRIFDGTDDYIIVGSAPTSIIDNQQGTILVWTNMTSGAFFSISDASEGFPDYRLFMSVSAGAERIEIRGGRDVGEDFRMATPDLSWDKNGTWQLIGFKSDGSTTKGTINGIEQTLQILAFSNIGDWFGDITQVDNITIGAEQRSDSFVNDMTGTIGEVLISNVYLSATEELHYYNRTRGRYQ